jgi:hypothetical protein
MERLRLEPARFELDIAELVMKHIDKLKSFGVLQIEDHGDSRTYVCQIYEGAARSGGSSDGLVDYERPFIPL